MKCLPANKMSQANGVILHDWHAEILAIRAFNHFVLEECRAVALGKRPSEYIRPRSDLELEEAEAAEAQGMGWNRQPYAWRDDVSLYMYCSESPCKFKYHGRIVEKISDDIDFPIRWRCIYGADNGSPRRRLTVGLLGSSSF